MLLCACLVFVLLKAGGYLFHGESGLLDVLAVLCFAGMFVAYIAYFGHVAAAIGTGVPRSFFEAGKPHQNVTSGQSRPICLANLCIGLSIKNQ